MYYFALRLGLKAVVVLLIPGRRTCPKVRKDKASPNRLKKTEHHRAGTS